MKLDINKPINLQKQISSTPAGKRIELMCGEYQGPVKITKSIAIDSKNQGSDGYATIVSKNGPVVTIKADDVELSNLVIEVGNKNQQLTEEEATALVISSSKNVRLGNVLLYGNVQGIKEEEGFWYYPYVINLGSVLNKMYCQCDYEFNANIFVPVDCKIKSDIEGVTVRPEKLSAGPNTIYIEVDSIPGVDCYLSGCIYIRTKFFIRKIKIYASLIKNISCQDTKIKVEEAIWQPKNWNTLVSEPEKPKLSNQGSSSQQTLLPPIIQKPLDIDPVQGNNSLNIDQITLPVDDVTQASNENKKRDTSNEQVRSSVTFKKNIVPEISNAWGGSKKINNAEVIDSKAPVGDVFGKKNKIIEEPQKPEKRDNKNICSEEKHSTRIETVVGGVFGIKPKVDEKTKKVDKPNKTEKNIEQGVSKKTKKQPLPEWLKDGK